MNEQRMAVSTIETPAVIVYMDVQESNIAEMSRLAWEAGVRMRPHTKIHECPEIARMQIAGGAWGIEIEYKNYNISSMLYRSSPCRNTRMFRGAGKV